MIKCLGTRDTLILHSATDTTIANVFEGANLPEASSRATSSKALHLLCSESRQVKSCGHILSIVPFRPLYFLIIYSEQQRLKWLFIVDSFSTAKAWTVSYCASKHEESNFYISNTCPMHVGCTYFQRGVLFLRWQPEGGAVAQHKFLAVTCQCSCTKWWKH